MQRKLHLVREADRERGRPAVADEERYRYPAHEEIWEVSCEEWDDDKPTLRTDRRRAS